MSGVLYWDTSAILSSLLQDVHTSEARGRLRSDQVHLASSLAGSEFHACLARLERDGHLSPSATDATAEAFAQGPWRRLTLIPDAGLFRPLASRPHLRGADLWHLALTVSLRTELPEITLLTYDSALRSAAVAEGLAT